MNYEWPNHMLKACIEVCIQTVVAKCFHACAHRGEAVKPCDEERERAFVSIDLTFDILYNTIIFYIVAIR